MPNIPHDSTPCVENSFNNIPSELRNGAPLWCCYKLEPDSGPTKKAKKIPQNPVTGKPARINDTSTLVVFAEAVAGVISGKYDGINRAFGYDEYVGIDLDSVLDQKTREFICDKAKEIHDKLKIAGAYIEHSPSRTGLRIICKGSLHGFGKGKPGFSHFEIYGTGDKGLHFLSFTGDTIGAVEEISECQKELDWFYSTYIERPKAPVKSQNSPSGTFEESPELSDEEVIDKYRKSRAGNRFTELFDKGSTGDHSSDDLEFCGMLAFYTQNKDQIDRLLRQSALYRDKWKRNDYRSSTINKALKPYFDGDKPTWQPAKTPEDFVRTSEMALAIRFAESNEAENFRIDRNSKKKSVYHYTGVLWVEDQGHFRLKLAVQDMVKTLLEEMPNIHSRHKRRTLLKAVEKLETRRGLDDITALALLKLQPWGQMPVDTKHMINLANGVYSLRSQRLLPHSAYWSFTQQSPVKFDLEARCPLWLKFIDEFCCGDKTLARFLQQWAGYCATEYTDE